MRINPLQIILFTLIIPISIYSQIGHGFSFDNYNGIYGSVTNPANTAQSKYRWHVNAISYNQLGISDFGAIDYFNIESNPTGFNGLNFEEHIDESSNFNFMVSDSDVMLPSVLYNINDNHAVGLILRSRSFSDYSNFNGQFFDHLYSGLENAEGGGEFNSSFNNTTQQWKEIGLNYAFVLLNANYHFIKIGGTAKYLLGNKAVEARGTLTGNYTSGTLGEVDFTSVDLTYLNTAGDNLQNNPERFYSHAFGGFSNSGSGYGGDLGMVYEWRPRETNRVDVRSNAGAVNTYKVKISASVLDIGSITYSNTIQQDSLFSTVPTSIENSEIADNGLVEALRQSPDITSNPQQGEVTFALPRSLNIGVDYILFNDKNYYINLNYIKSLTKQEDLYTNSRLDLITLTPRYETQKFSVYLPIAYEQNSSDVSAGIGVRFGPITIGSASLSNFIIDGNMKHLYFGLNLPLFQDVFR
ncbi:MAG TPA: hypothetical protein DCG42_00795 [Maribacter sp.]|uniref:DUF5723 family protein n=1 Tax=unclassified Maribacter TaxID=2615042 RepID=UPI000EE5A8BE|nr:MULTISPECIES: DUF5723 family protein [unclassified Maribacter]HAF75832.1 hypothetical protein [Maribacter sp.]|tara:strand:- start:396 stop:1802 length:1407 start_codon:yes stop_codon:yes gene_type:complete